MAVATSDFRDCRHSGIYSVETCMVGARKDLIKVEGPSKLLSSNILRDCDLPCTFIACDNLMSPVGNFFLA